MIDVTYVNSSQVGKLRHLSEWTQYRYRKKEKTRTKRSKKSLPKMYHSTNWSKDYRKNKKIHYYY